MSSSGRRFRQLFRRSSTSHSRDKSAVLTPESIDSVTMQPPIPSNEANIEFAGQHRQGKVSDINWETIATCAEENVTEKSRREKIMSKLRQAPGKLKRFREKSKSVAKRMVQKVKTKISCHHPAPGDDHQQKDCEDHSTSSDSIADGNEALVSVETSTWNGRTASSRKTAQCEQEVVTDIIDVTSGWNDDCDLALVTLVFSPSFMDPPLIKDVSNILGIAETDINDRNDIILKFVASTRQGPEVVFSFYDIFGLSAHKADVGGGCLQTQSVFESFCAAKYQRHTPCSISTVGCKSRIMTTTLNWPLDSLMNCQKSEESFDEIEGLLDDEYVGALQAQLVMDEYGDWIAIG